MKNYNMKNVLKKVMVSLLASTLVTTPITIPTETKANIIMPATIDLSTSPYFPEISSQGGNGCCVAMANVYYQFSYEMNKSRNTTSTQDNVFSPYAVYNMFNTNNGSLGISVSECYSVMKNYGVPLWADTDFDDSADDCYASRSIWENRTNYRISDSYTQSYSTANSKIDEIKKSLINEKIVTFNTYSSSWILGTIKESTNGSSNNNLVGDRIIYDLDGKDGYHRVTFVGYDDNIWFDSDHDGERDENEMGAFKLANSWGKAWGNNGFCWMTYDSIRKNHEMITDYSTIEAAPYNSDSDIKLVVDITLENLLDSNLTLTAYSKYTDQVYEKSFAPFNTYSYNSTSNIFRGFSTNDNHGSLAYDLDMLIPDINEDNFNDYCYKLTISDSGKYNGATKLNDAYIYDYNSNVKLSNFNCTKEALSGNRQKLIAQSLVNPGFDFKVTDLKYTNHSNTSDDYNSKDIIMTGDILSLTSTVENIGCTKSPDNRKLGVLYTVTDENGNSVNIPNVWSDNYVNQPGLEPLQKVELTSNGGENNGNGTISFSQPGTYKITAWVNDVNDFPDELGGRYSPNNKRSITVRVIPNVPFEVESWNISNSNPTVGEPVTVTANLKDAADCEIKLSALTNSHFSYKSFDYVDGNTISITFDHEGTYSISATVRCKATKKCYSYTNNITVTKAQESKPLAVGSLSANKSKIQKDDTITFTVNDVNKSNVATKIVVYSPYDKYRTPIYESDFVSGTSVNIKISNIGLLSAYAIVKDLDTNETVTLTCQDNFSCYETVGGYDFAIRTLTCENYTTGLKTVYKTDNTTDSSYSNDIHVGDKIKFGATVFNVGDETSDSGKKLGVQFQINGNTSDITWCDNYYNNSGLMSNSSIYLLACGGSISKDGFVTFSQPGTYNVTAWVNDTNDYTSECGGYQAANNKVTFKVVVK